jgi:broad specificity phosphatase PhoE
MPLRLHLLRHGQTPTSRENVFCGANLDPELTPDGVAMAQAFADAHASTEWTRIYAGPLQRTQRTAEIIAQRTQVPFETRAAITEIDYGRWDGLSAEVVDQEFHDDYVRWTADPAWNAPTDGETAIALARRMLGAVEEVTRENHDGNVLFVTHKASIRALLCTLLGVDVGRFRFRFACPTGSVSVIEFGRRGPLALSIADRSHLSVALQAAEGT